MTVEHGHDEFRELRNEMLAPSEEFTLHCDVPGCQAQLSMVSGVPRSEHGWGRVSVYEDLNAATVMRDYDLCVDHFRKVLTVLIEGRGADR